MLEYFPKFGLCDESDRYEHEHIEHPESMCMYI